MRKITQKMRKITHVSASAITLQPPIAARLAALSRFKRSGRAIVAIANNCADVLNG
jgi:hypothetical protein